LRITFIQLVVIFEEIVKIEQAKKARALDAKVNKLKVTTSTETDAIVMVF